MACVRGVWNGVKGVRGEEAHDSVGRAVGDDGELFSAGQVIKLKNSIGFAVVGRIATGVKR